MGGREDEGRWGRGGGSEEEEGYVKGEFKLHYREEVCGMALLPETRYEEFMNMVQRKFDVVPGALGMEFKDDDGARLRSGTRWTMSS
ncbi:hypothetical protein ACG7TL_004002 [Trametes sanguinea]